MTVNSQQDSTTGRAEPQKSTNNAAHTHISSGIDGRGNYPNTWYLQGEVVGAAAGVLYTSGDSRPYNRLTVQVSGLTATSADVYVSVDGVNFSAARMWDASTGAVFATNAITANGIYYLDAKYAAYRIDQVGAGAVTVRYAHSVK